MEKIHVNASKEYDVLIAENILPEIGEYISGITAPCKAAVVADDRVFEIYGNTVIKSLKAGGFDVCAHTFKNGETSKNMTELENILDFLAENQLTRSDIVIALGGGVTGDMAGFAAAVYLRGIRFVQVPTTFLSAVDASVGGKTAVDLKSGKNLAGAFHQPSLVICDTKTFDTLDDKTFADGISEAIKCGALRDAHLFSLMKGNPRSDAAEIVSRAVTIKRDLVAEDEFDTGARQLLNYGHTVGHAIEKCSGFSITHGHAVAIGMAVITKAAEADGICEKGTYDTLCENLRANGLPTVCEYGAAELYDVILSDKKRSGYTITLVLPKKIGWCDLYKMPVSELPEFIKKGL